MSFFFLREGVRQGSRFTSRPRGALTSGYVPSLLATHSAGWNASHAATHHFNISFRPIMYSYREKAPLPTRKTPTFRNLHIDDVSTRAPRTFDAAVMYSWRGLTRVCVSTFPKSGAGMNISSYCRSKRLIED
jgi:hypothetical protein